MCHAVRSLCVKKGALLAQTALTEHGVFFANEVDFEAIARHADKPTMLNPLGSNAPRPGVKVEWERRAPLD